MKKIILSIFLIFFAMLFAQENILLKSDAQAELNGYDYVKNFTVNSTSGYFTKDSFKILEPNEKGFRVCVEVPDTSTSYDILPSYPSFLNEANIGAGYIENAGSIKKRLSSTKQLKKANWDADDRTSAEPFYLLLQ